MTGRILLVGTGLVGGSIGLGLRRRGDVTVVGYDRAVEASERAKELGAVDEIAHGLDAAGEADVVVIATPVGQIIPTVRAVTGSLREGAVVTDVGSTKVSIVSEAEQLLGSERPFVGGHPMAGTEGEGIEAARGDLFDGALWLLTPTDHTDTGAYRRVHGLVSALGATSLALEPAEHDRLVALVSHLPYTLATALMDLAGEEGDDRVFRAAAGSFRDVTRTAGTNPQIWTDILMTNRDAVLRAIDAFGAHLGRLRAALAEGRWEDATLMIERARTARARIPLKGHRAPAEPVQLEVPIPDRAGVLAKITTALGETGINIEDLWMDHTGAGGVVRLLFDGRATAEQAAERLADEGFRSTVVVER